MMCLDIFLLSLSEKEIKAIKHKVKPFAPTPFRLMSLDISSMHIYSLLEQRRKASDLFSLIIMREKFGWQVDLEKLLESDYTALIVTNPQQVIIWVNDGYIQMSGYPKNFTLGKTPQFLQGPQTCRQTKKRIRDNIVQKKAVKETILNYRKNKQPYYCRVEILPLLNAEQELTHLIALEKEVIAP